MLAVYDAIEKRYTITENMLYLPPTEISNLNDTPLIHIAECGTCLRFVLPYFAFSDFKFVEIEMGVRLAQRPIDQLIDALNSAGGHAQRYNDKILIIGKEFCIDGFSFDSSDSSQFLSSLMMFATTLMSSSENAIKIDFTDSLPSKSYINMTADVMRLFGFEAIRDDDKMKCTVRMTIQPNDIDITLDPDYSTVCYHWFYSYLCQRELFIKKMGIISQPDYAFIDILKQIGILFIETEESISVSAKSLFPLPTSEYNIDMSDNPDQIITLSFIALVSGITVHISGCETLSHKESDRIAGIIENISILGGSAIYNNEILSVYPLKSSGLLSEKPVLLKTFNDHRFALTFLVLREKHPHIQIDNIDCIKKSAVDFLLLLVGED
jgi:3-phosphoshikimate 1-carboxyvinyltransferase